MIFSPNSVPISPPVTPKITLEKERSMSPVASIIQLPPPSNSSSSNNNNAFFTPTSPPHYDLIKRRPRKASRVYRFISTASEDVIHQSSLVINRGKNRSKSRPYRSLPACTQGTFMMDVGVICRIIKGRKNRKNSKVTQNKSLLPTFDTVSILNTERHVRKAKTDAAAAYDSVDITVSDEEALEPEWVPNMNVFNHSLPTVVWKGTPLLIKHLPYYELLHPGEVYIASTLRITPEQYLKCRRSLILAAKEFNKRHLQFRKSDAQKCARIDVNKISMLWSVFNKLGWFNPH